MKIEEILEHKNHRPWMIPNENWRFYQEWNRAIFLHWRVDIEELKKFVPKEIEIDLFNGEAWVSVVAFTMEKIRPKNLPYFAPISNFDEINVRTYVKEGERTGVYFLSIEGGKKMSCKLAKGISELPYRYSKMSRNTNSYNSKNDEFNDQLDVEFNIGNQIEKKSELDVWLTERYALFQDAKDYINEYEIHHVEWTLNTIELERVKLNYPRFKKLINNEPDLSHYSKGIQVVAWDKKKR